MVDSDDEQSWLLSFTPTSAAYTTPSPSEAKNFDNLHDVPVNWRGCSCYKGDCSKCRCSSNSYLCTPRCTCKPDKCKNPPRVRTPITSPQEPNSPSSSSSTASPPITAPSSPISATSSSTTTPPITPTPIRRPTMDPATLAALQAIGNSATALQQQLAADRQANTDTQTALIARINDITQLIQDQRNALQANPLAPLQNRNVRVKMEAGEQFSGAKGESVIEWIGKVNRRAIAETWTNDEKRRAAIGALQGNALTWHEVIGTNHADWPEWITALRDTYSENLTETQWVIKTEQRRQLPGESISNYFMEKIILLRQRPNGAPPEAEMIPFIVRGLRDSSVRSAVMSQQIATLDAFLIEVRRLENYCTDPVYGAANSTPTQLPPPTMQQPTVQPGFQTVSPGSQPVQQSVQPMQPEQGVQQPFQQPQQTQPVHQSTSAVQRQMVQQPPPTQQPQGLQPMPPPMLSMQPAYFSTQLAQQQLQNQYLADLKIATLEQMLKNQHISQRRGETTGVNRPPPVLTGANVVPLGQRNYPPATEETKCYNCNKYGHYARNCPLAQQAQQTQDQGNARAGSTGQSQQQ